MMFYSSNCEKCTRTVCKTRDELGNISDCPSFIDCTIDPLDLAIGEWYEMYETYFKICEKISADDHVAHYRIIRIRCHDTDLDDVFVAVDAVDGVDSLTMHKGDAVHLLNRSMFFEYVREVLQESIDYANRQMARLDALDDEMWVSLSKKHYEEYT